MKKTYYFQHDFQSFDDPKIQFIIAKFGAEGYGLWWRIVEMLHQDEHNRLPLKDYLFFAIEGQLGLDKDMAKEFVNSCINDVQLLQADGEFFWSDRVLKNVGRMNDVKEKRSQAGKKSAEKRTSVEQALTSVEQNSASVEQNSTKEKKIKKIKRYSKPSLQEVIDFFEENGFTSLSAIKAYNYYNEADWTDSTGKKVKSWKQKMRGVWFKDENKTQQRPTVQFSIPVN